VKKEKKKKGKSGLDFRTYKHYSPKAKEKKFRL